MVNVQISDRDAFGRVTLVGLNSYLESTGWERRTNWQGRMQVWGCDRGAESTELLAPLREHSAGYAVRIGEAISDLAVWEGRSQVDVFQDLVAARADVVRFRPLNRLGVTDWSVVDGAALLGMSRDLIAAAARGAEYPGQAVYRWRASGTVAGYLREVRAVFGLRGWDDFALHSPVPADFGLQADFGDDYLPPFARQATMALHTGLHEAGNVRDKVIAGVGVSEAIEAAVPRGLNANMCDALAGLIERSHGMSVRLTWASVRPRDTALEAFSFVESSADVLRGGAEWLRRNSPYLNAHITGDVVILAREPDVPFDGDAVVVYELDGKAVSLQVQFPEQYHDVVIMAFREGIPLSLDGDIYRVGRRYEVHSLRNVNLVRPNEAGDHSSNGR